MTNIYNPSEYTKYHQAGTAEVKGQAFLKTAGGEVRFGAGETVSLIPATAYSEEVIGYIQNYQFIRPSGVDPRWSEHFKKTTADGNGNFEFADVPAGTYYLECPIYWMAGDKETGHTVYKKVEVHDGDKIKVVLTD
ncbi:MAG: hypothetical protein PHR16_11875 [Methylovulum sp.]|nr:hypothetical protein [Methylovulum sp.]